MSDVMPARSKLMASMPSVGRIRIGLGTRSTCDKQDRTLCCCRDVVRPRDRGGSSDDGSVYRSLLLR